MAGHGAPDISPAAATADKPLTMAIIASSWHEQVMDGLVAGAQRAAEQAGIEAPVHWVPGSFELPVATQAALKNYDCVVALGVVIRGGTPHFDYVCSAVTDGLNRVGLDAGKPVGFGVLTCDTEAQALDRAGLPGSTEDKGFEAASAALATANLLRDLG